MEESKIRIPAVSGQFYPSSQEELKNQVESLIDKKQEKKDIIACMFPHAGYMYSGRVAGQTVSRISIKERIILLGPNHTGYGMPYSIMTDGVWQTPLGNIRIDANLAKRLLGNSKYLASDITAHLYEHSLEVELPFLQYFKSDFEIVPIVFLSDEIDTLKEIGKEIADTIKENNIKDSTIILASSDMTHYEPDEVARKKDSQAIQAILELDEDGLVERIERFSISMCGYAPVVVMLSAAKVCGAKNAQLIKYETSGDITGDKSSVVGYAGIIVY
jgi:AmmeMemoRadiSam system protein B